MYLVNLFNKLGVSHWRTVVDLLIADLRLEKIVIPANRHDAGWNDAIEYIIQIYLQVEE